MKRGLLFAGAFNPVTIAHVNCADKAMHDSHRDYVIFVPSKETYIRFDQKKDYVYSDSVRLAMLKKAVSDRADMLVSDYELCSDHQPRTYETLCALKRQGYECSLLFGSDKLQELSSAWLHVEEIAQEFGIVCMTRNHLNTEEIIEKDPLLCRLKDRIETVDNGSEMQDISSSSFRRLVREGKYQEAVRLLPSSLQDASELFETESESYEKQII